MAIVPFTLYLMKYRLDKSTGINFVDSTIEILVMNFHYNNVNLTE